MADGGGTGGGMAEPCVRMSGTVLASLLFQHANGDSDVGGLILGERRLEQQVTISDSQADQVQIQETYNVQKHAAFPELHRLCSSSGQVNMEELQRLLAPHKQGSVIGWYRQRRNSQQQLSFREKLFHEDLKRALSNPDLLFMLLTPSQATPTGTTHTMEYCAFISRGSRLRSLTVLVANLGLLGQQGYWQDPAPCLGAGALVAMKKHGFFSSDGQPKEVSEVTRVSEMLQEELQSACRRVDHSERLLESLRAEVSSLRLKLRAKRPMAPEAEPVDAVGQRDNVPLRDAVAALLGHSPLLLTQTLTLQAFPVPCADVSMATQDNPRRDARPAPQTKTACRKRPREAASGKDRKCGRSRC